MHAKHTKRWAIEHDIALSESDDPADRQLAVDRRLLEEPRMEAHGVREFPPDSLRGRFVRRALQAAVADVILPAFTEQVLELAAACQPLTRDLAARATVYLRGPHPVRDRRPGRPDRVGRAVARGARRARPPRARRPVRQARVDPRRRARAARRGGPRVPANRRRARPATERRRGRRAREDPVKAGERPTPAKATAADSGGGPAAGSLADALEQAIATARAGQLEQLDEDVDLQQVLENAAAGGEAREQARPRARDRAADRPAARPRRRPAAVPRRGAARPPLRQPAAPGDHPRDAADRQAHPGRALRRARLRTRPRRAGRRPAGHAPIRGASPARSPAPIQEPHVGLIIDTSGSMGGYEYALGPIAWILTDGLRQIGGRCATALFGNSAELLSDGTRPLPLVPGIRTGGGTAFAGDAIELVSDQLEMTNPRRPRFVYVLSDGGWADTRAGVERIRAARRARRPDDPPQHRDRAAVGRVRPHHRDHRPRPGARPHRRRHRRRARRPPPPPARPLTNLSPERKQARCRHPTLPCCPVPLCSTSPPSPRRPVEGSIERVELDALELAPNARREISREGIERLAGMLMRTGQLVPCIGHRPDPAQPRTVIYDGQRRLLAAQASGELAGADGYEGLAPVQSLIVLLLDHEPGADEIRRIQAQANQRESLSLVDQQEQLRDCWEARAGLPEADRIAAVCADLGISPKRAHNLRRQLALPDPIRTRVAERPTGEQISVTMANRLADMHEIAPQLTEAVAKRITSTDLHDKALQDLGAFVHRTVVEDEHTYAVRIDDGAMLDAAEQIEHARAHLDRRRPAPDRQRSSAASSSGSTPSSTRSPPAPRPER